MDAAEDDEGRAVPLHPSHVSFTSPSSPPLSPFASLSSPSSRDPLLSLHSQLSSIAQRTSRLCTPSSDPPASLDDVVRRLREVEQRVDEQVRALHNRLADVTERLRMLEGGERRTDAMPSQQEEETKQEGDQGPRRGEGV